MKLSELEKSGLISLLERSFANSKTLQLQITTYTSHKNVGRPKELGGHDLVPMFKIQINKLKGNNWETFHKATDESLEEILNCVPWIAVDTAEENCDFSGLKEDSFSSKKLHEDCYLDLLSEEDSGVEGLL